MPTIVRRVSFSKESEPFIEFTHGDRIWRVNPLQSDTINLQFDATVRYCIGRFDMTTWTDYPCPHQECIPTKYEQCVSCIKATGFNPAFYNTNDISPQQLSFNAEPHIVYLAYFAPDCIKVGISNAKRGIGRLLEQGARAAIILAECPSANIARSYEAKATGFHRIRDSVQLGKKMLLAEKPFDSKQATAILLQYTDELETALNASFSHDVLLLDPYYFNQSPPDLHLAINLSEQSTVIGQPLGMLGSILYCRYHDDIVYLPLKKYIGYAIDEAAPDTIMLPQKQLTLL